MVNLSLIKLIKYSVLLKVVALICNCVGDISNAIFLVRICLFVTIRYLLLHFCQITCIITTA